MLVSNGVTQKATPESSTRKFTGLVAEMVLLVIHTEGKYKHCTVLLD